MGAPAFASDRVLERLMALHPKAEGHTNEPMAVAAKHAMYCALFCTSCADACSDVSTTGTSDPSGTRLGARGCGTRRAGFASNNGPSPNDPGSTLRN